MSHTSKGRGGEGTRLSVSQNFITSGRLLQRIVGIAGIRRKDTVVEIGAGKGQLTRALARRCGLLYAIELDRRLFESARDKLRDLDNLRLIHGDFLTWPLPERGPYRVFANIPFAITTRIVEKLTRSRNPPRDIWLVMERGAALRFMGRPRDNRHSLPLKARWELRVRYCFNREDFHPSPGVDSVLLHLKAREAPDLSQGEAAAFQRFIDQAARRGLFALMTRKQASTALRLAQLPTLQPDRPILYIQWLCLFRCHQRLSGQSKSPASAGP